VLLLSLIAGFTSSSSRCHRCRFPDSASMMSKYKTQPIWLWTNMIMLKEYFRCVVRHTDALYCYRAMKYWHGYRTRHGHVDTCQTHQIQSGNGRRCRVGVGVGVVSDTTPTRQRIGCPCFIGYQNVLGGSIGVWVSISATIEEEYIRREIYDWGWAVSKNKNTAQRNVRLHVSFDTEAKLAYMHSSCVLWSVAYIVSEIIDDFWIFCMNLADFLWTVLGWIRSLEHSLTTVNSHLNSKALKDLLFRERTLRDTFSFAVESFKADTEKIREKEKDLLIGQSRIESLYIWS